MKGCVFLLATLFSTFSIAQEIPLGKLPPPRPVPDAVAFRLLFHQAAAFKKRSDAMDTAGSHTNAFAHHLQHKFTLTAAQADALMLEAENYAAEVAPTTLQIDSLRDEVTAWHSQGRPERADFSARARALILQRDVITLKHRDRFAEILPPNDYARMHSVLAAMCSGDTVTAVTKIREWELSGAIDNPNAR